MKRLLVGVSLVIIVLFMGCGRSSEEVLVDNFFSSISEKDEAAFLNCLDTESKEFWQEFECTFDDLDYSRVTSWSVSEIEEVEEGSEKVIIEIVDPGDVSRKTLTLNLIKDGNEWKVRIKDKLFSRLLMFSNQCFNHMKVMGVSNEVYLNDKSKYATNLLTLVTEDYIAKVYTCPACGKEYRYELTEDGFEIYCPCPGRHLNPNTKNKVKKVYYDSVKGIVIE